MKKLIIPIGILITGTVKSQLSTIPNTENYVQTKTYLDYNGTSVTKSSETVQYLDGLGRPKQIVNIQASPLGKDVVVPVVYDQFGRQTKEYLPIPQGSTLNGNLVSDPFSNVMNSPYGSEKIYSEKIIENSPLDRVLEQKQVGNEWNAKPVKFAYDVNTAEDKVRKFAAPTTLANGITTSTISNDGMYGDFQLYKNTVADEDENKTIEFKNSRGQVILVRKVISATENADTYYVYNKFDQLVFVIPPLLSQLASWGMPEHDALAYQYRYDGRNRLVGKKLPGKGWEFMVYDKQDKLVATQDAVLNGKGQWLFTKYDELGRVAYTGISTGGTWAQEQAKVETFGFNNVNRTVTVGLSGQGMDVYYGNADFSYPESSSLVTLLSVNYYDTYPGYSFNPALPVNTTDMTVLTDTSSADGRSTRGLPLMSLVKNIEDDNWTKSYSYYDTKGRAIGSHSINHLGGYTRAQSELDFAGLPKKTVTIHKRLATESGITITERFDYDNQNRLLVHKHQVDDKPEQILAENSYNEISQLTNKKVGNNLQSIDYSYNIRGWLTHINKDQMSVPDLGGKLFSYKIKYNQMTGLENPDPALFSGKNVKPKYNGNIAEVDWRAIESIGANPPTEPKRYGYAYDALNRLTAGYYQNPVNPYSKEHTESLAYDLNGNIRNLYRTAAIEGSTTTATVIDELEYIYGSNNLTNQVSVIKDHKNNPSGYEGGGGTILYDLNGNMGQMPDKNISKITYNHLNLPDKIEYGTMGFDGMHHYLYRADGAKVQKKLPKFECGFASCYTITGITDYLDGFQYYHSESDNNGGGIGGLDGFLMTTEKAKYAYEQQAYSAESGIATAQGAPLGITTVKTPYLMFFPTAEGFYDYGKDQYIYQYKDHLGNARISFARNSAGALEITDANDYYPFGMNHLKTGNSFFGNASYKNYKYNGKELQETGMYDYGARFYMPDLGRWGVVDPLAEKYTRMSPYTYVGNNPARFVDYDGRDYGVYVDFKTGTITIKATYYATANHLKSANGATKLWNDMSGKYNYTYKDANGNKVSLKVNFQLTTSEVAQEKGKTVKQSVENAAKNDTTGEGNSYRIASDESFTSDTHMGVTQLGKYARVREGQEDVNKGTGGHEVGHTLGVEDGTNIMGGQDNTTITSSHISEILNAIGSTPVNPNESTSPTNPKATIHVENNNLKTDKEYENFRNGKVKSAN